MYEDRNALVLEDLNRLDYKLANRKQRLDVARAKIVLTKVAQFHAATAVIQKKSPKLVERYENSVNNSEEMTPISFFFIVSMQETLETIRNTPELEHLAARLEEFDIVEREKDVFSRSPEEKFHALNHGDLWSNNIFFSYDGQGEPVDALLVSVVLYLRNAKFIIVFNSTIPL